jgi:stringent starvation protein B
MSMTSSRPYLIRALYEWINDNYLTPYIVINAEVIGTVVPQDFVNQGKIVLNISPEAIHKLLISNEAIQFDARFSGISRRVYAPVHAVLAIYAEENGAGMVFGEEPGGDKPPTAEPGPSIKGAIKRKKPSLKIVRSRD